MVRAARGRGAEGVGGGEEVGEARARPGGERRVVAADGAEAGRESLDEDGAGAAEGVKQRPTGYDAHQTACGDRVERSWIAVEAIGELVDAVPRAGLDGTAPLERTASLPHQPGDAALLPAPPLRCINRVDVSRKRTPTSAVAAL